MDRLGEPQTFRIHLSHLSPCPEPELQRYKRGDIAAETIHYAGPLFQRVDLVIPEFLLSVVEVNDIVPFADAVSEAPVRFVIKPFRMADRQHGVRRRVVVHNIDNHLHAEPMRVADKSLKVLFRAEIRIDSPKVLDRVG